MEYLPNGITLELPDGTFPLSTDSMVLSYFSRLPRNASVLDIGSGCATLGLLLCSNSPSCNITGIEIDPIAHQAALENIRRNGLSGRLQSIQANAADIPALFACMNAKKLFNDWNSAFYYDQMLASGGKASDCIKCGKCEKLCPQHLPIRKLLEDVAAEFEKKEA